MHHYHKLREVLDTHPIGAPDATEFIEILKILFQPDELELALLLDFNLKNISEIATKAGLAEEIAFKKLEALADRGAILAKKIGEEPAYALLPNYPGLFEYPFMKGMDQEKQKRLAELWHAYYMKAMARELASANPPWFRVLPAEEALSEEYEILPYEVASQLMTKSKVIALADCPCRTAANNCEKPRDVCLSFDGAAKFLSERGMARIISYEEAKDVLKKSEQAGLVHTCSNSAGKLIFMCNCCACCCHFLRLIIEHNYPEALAKSSYQAELNANECSGCGTCAEERCPVKAIIINNDVAELNSEKCIGCGLCVSTCPTGALRLVKRADYKSPPANASELVAKIVKNKGTR